MKVLFVDDETRVLSGLERALLVGGLEWDARFAAGGEAALAAIAAERFDVVVSDMRMPQVDGAAVLRAARDRDPATVRIVLSGQADETSALATVRVAHQFLAKPCDVKVLRQTVERTETLNRRLIDPELRAIVGSVDQLPPALHIFQQLSEAVSKEDASIDEVAALVRQDPAIASKLLQFVNSAFFAQPREISDIKSAVVRLGMKTVKNLVLGVGIFDTAGKWKLPPLVSVEELQRHGFMMARIASSLVTDPKRADAAYMAALVCDVGELVLAATLPDQLQKAWQRAVEASLPRSVFEQQLLGATHAEVGACLLGLWGLPFGVVEAVAGHHLPDENHSTSDLTNIVWLASCVAGGETPDPARVSRCGFQPLLERAVALRNAADR
jgi:HD-like signal output (HDOD) protein